MNSCNHIKQARNMSFSAYHAFNQCGFKYYLTYVLGVQSKKLSINLGFGNVIDDLCSNYVSNLALGRFYDPMKDLDNIWKKRIESQPAWEFGKQMTCEHYYHMARIFAEQLPEVWANSGLQPMKSVTGEPLVQWRILHEIGGIKMNSVIDLICYHPETDLVVPIDLKTAKTPAPLEWMPTSEQLATYAHAMDSDPRIPFKNSGYGGFLEFIKRKPRLPTDEAKKKLMGPTTNAPVVFKLNERTFNELPIRYQITQDRINRGEFMAQPNMAFDTPCGMCDFSDYCRNGDASFLQKRNLSCRNDQNKIITKQAV